MYNTTHFELTGIILLFLAFTGFQTIFNSYRYYQLRNIQPIPTYKIRYIPVQVPSLYWVPGPFLRLLLMVSTYIYIILGIIATSFHGIIFCLQRCWADTTFHHLKELYMSDSCGESGVTQMSGYIVFKEENLKYSDLVCQLCTPIFL